MEDKEVQMALYGVSIAIVTHYEDILLAMKLGKQTEAENTIKKIISLIEYEDNMIDYLNSKNYDHQIEGYEHTWQMRLAYKNEYFRKKNNNEEDFKEYSYHIKALKDIYDIIFSGKLELDKTDSNFNQKIKQAYLESSIKSMIQNPDFERKMLNLGFDITKINVDLPPLEPSFALENCFEIINLIASINPSYDPKSIVENLFNQKLFENYFLSMDENSKNEVLNYLEDIVESNNDNYYLNALYNFAKGYFKGR